MRYKCPKSIRVLAAFCLLVIGLGASSAYADQACALLFGFIPGYAISGGKIVSVDPEFKNNGFDLETFFLTDEFFKKSGLEVPKDATPIFLSTYRYYDPNKQYHPPDGPGIMARRLNRGAGRDHQLPNGIPGENITAKGSGVNTEFSSSNGQFDIKNFRSNGLQEDVEVTSEYIVVKQLQKLGVPIVDHPEIMLAPLEIQKAIGSINTYGYMIGRIAAQTKRRQNKLRESYAGVETVPNEARYKIVASVLVNNV